MTNYIPIDLFKCLNGDNSLAEKLFVIACRNKFIFYLLCNIYKKYKG